MDPTRDDKPVTPAGRLFLQPQLNQVINCAVSFKNHLQTDAIKAELSTSLMVNHPRFSSLLVLDNKGKEFWRRTQVNLDDHLIIHDQNPIINSYSDEEREEKINSLLADFAVSCPLSTEKPLWEIHFFSDLRCLIIRIHHALGDGISLMSLFLASCKRLDGEIGEENKMEEKKIKEKKKGFVEIWKGLLWTIIAVFELIRRCLWVKDVKTAISGGDGVELWPRMAATARFSLDDMKVVKRALPNATINDVLFGVLSSGFSKYLDFRSSHGLLLSCRCWDANFAELWAIYWAISWAFGILLPSYYIISDSTMAIDGVMSSSPIPDIYSNLASLCRQSSGFNQLQALLKGAEADVRLPHYIADCGRYFDFSDCIYGFNCNCFRKLISNLPSPISLEDFTAFEDFDLFLRHHSLPALQEGLQITGLAMVNLRSQPGLQDISKLMENNSKASWGNQFGMILLPISCKTKDDDPLNYVKRAKVMMDKKKQSLEAHFSYNIGNLIMSLFGPKAASILNHRIICNTTFTISNIVGPQEQLSFVGNPITCIRVTSCGLPHAVTMHMVSYAGMANLQVLVAKEIIPDPKFLAKCFEDALIEMKNAAIIVA